MRILEVDKLPKYQRNYSDSLLTYFGSVRPENFQAPCFGSPISIDSLKLSEEKRIQFKGVLCIIGSAYPNLEYTPFVPVMVACFLAYLTPDDVLGAMASLIKGHSIPADKKLEWAYFPLNRRDFLVFQRVFEDLLKKLLPKIWRCIARCELENPNYVPDWKRILSTMFIEIYPLELVTRIIDAFLVEGYKIVLRFALGHLALRKRTIYAAKSWEELDFAMFSPFHEISSLEVDKLFQLAFDFKFSRKDIWRYRNRNRKLSLEDFDMEDRVLIFHRPLPILLRPSEFVTEAQWSLIWSWIPARFRLLNLRLAFSTTDHGFSLQTLYSTCGGLEPLLMIVKTLEDSVFGAFLSKSFSNRSGNSFYGTGETFLFALHPDQQRFSWDHRSDSSAFICASSDFLAVGAGHSGFGLRIDDDLKLVWSNESFTFSSERLFRLDDSSEKNNQIIQCLEIFSFI